MGLDSDFFSHLSPLAGVKSSTVNRALCIWDTFIGLGHV